VRAVRDSPAGVIAGVLLILFTAIILAMIFNSPAAVTVPPEFKSNLWTIFLITMVIIGIGATLASRKSI